MSLERFNSLQVLSRAIAAVALAALLALAPLPASIQAQDAAAPAAATEAATDEGSDDKGDEKDLVRRFSYAYGVILARRLKESGATIDVDTFAAAYKAVANGEEPTMTDDEMRAVFKEHEDYVSGSFLRNNAKREGVTVTDSGLQWEVLKKAEGPKPKATDTVRVHYQGTLTNGEVFDSSYERGEPISFPLDGVIAGWTEGVQLMPVGSKFRMVIPYDLAYGERGFPPDIPPKATLVFEIELLGIE